MSDVEARFALRSDVERIREEIRSARRLGVDTEFHAERRYSPQLMLVQVGIEGGSVWLFDPHDRALLTELAADLRSRDWVLHGGFHDLRLLAKTLGGLPERVHDTQVAAGLCDTGFPRSYAHLVDVWLNKTLEKGETLSDWSRRPLSASQLKYAIEDVELLFPLWDRVSAAVAELGRADALAAACREFRDDALAEPHPDAVWKEIPGVQHLDARSLATLKILARWRDDIACRDDQPPRAVFPDPLLLEIARRRPTTVGAIACDRRVSKAVLKRFGDAIVSCVQEALELPEPPPLPRDRSALALAHLEVAMEAVGAASRWSARLVAPKRALGMALANPADRAALSEGLGWRDPLVGDSLWGLIQGTLVTGLAGGDVQVFARAGQF